MCGIAGYWNRDPGPANATPMADALLHRGPDDGGAWSDPEVGIALAQRRLSIVDLSPAGHQPMASPCGRYVLVFNGEIYNHLTLRETLERDGCTGWRGHSDTETLVVAIARWGLDATLTRCVGMFAIALWDRHERTLSLARDRMGEKPLYYGWSGAGVVFGSELKALRAAPGFANVVDPDVLSLYFRYNYVPAPWSILKHIFKVEPGVVITLGGEALRAVPSTAPSAADASTVPGLVCKRYWSLDAIVAEPADESMTDDQAVAAMEARLTESIALQTVADVPVGAFLSGGVDSSAVVALMRNTTNANVQTFTIGFTEADFDEVPYAAAVARHLGTDHHEMFVTAADALAVIANLPRIYDEPFADSSQIPTVLLSRLTRRHVTVALSGDGGDELFCGYNRYLMSRRYWTTAGAIPAPIRSRIGKAITAISPTTWDRLGGLPLLPEVPMLGRKAHKLGRMLQTSIGIANIYRSSSEEWQTGLPITTDIRLQSPGDTLAELRTNAEEQMMHWDMTSYLPNDILTKVDRASMACSLETRVPFLDHRVVEQAWRTPLSMKMRAGQGKWLLRQILYRYVPKELIERPKAGFAIPIGAWLRGPLRDWADSLLSDDALSRSAMLDAPAIRRRWLEHVQGTHDWTAALWGVLMYQAWAAEWTATC